MIHHHPKCKHKSQRIEDGTTRYIVVGVAFASHFCQTPNESHPCVDSGTGCDCVILDSRPAIRLSIPDSAAPGKSRIDQDQVHSGTPTCSSASALEEKSCILVAARVLKRLRL